LVDGGEEGLVRQGMRRRRRRRRRRKKGGCK
jgi:hypothetical protein